jgi:LCP family protein required for cell wall assembly
MPDDRRPYRTYRSAPRGLGARLRGETDPEVGRRFEEQQRAKPLPRTAGRGAQIGGPAGPAVPAETRWRGGRDPIAPPPTGSRFERWRAKPWGWKRVVKYVIALPLLWIGLSLVLFVISAQENSGSIPASAQAQLSSTAVPMLFSPQTVLILGLDNRPVHGAGSLEPGSNYSEADANTDSIMLWRIGGGVSRRLSIPRDTLVNIPGYGPAKINAAWSRGAAGPGLVIRVIKQLTGISAINHLIVVDLANFPKFINDIGGVTVKTPRICAENSEDSTEGGYFKLNLSPGVHTLNGHQALVLARDRQNACNPAYNDLNREAMQQQIMNAIQSQLISVPTFIHLPWASWDAPRTIQTDMGSYDLMQLFLSSEVAGSSPPELLKETGEEDGYVGDVLVPNPANVRAQVNKLLNG